MNAIHQISLKLQMGIDPQQSMSEEQLRSCYREFMAQRRQTYPTSRDNRDTKLRARAAGEACSTLQ